MPLALGLLCALVSPLAFGVLVLVPWVVALSRPVLAGARGRDLSRVLAGTGRLELAYGVLLGVALAFPG